MSFALRTLSPYLSLSLFQAGIVSLSLKYAWILCVRESEHLSRKLVAKNSPGASVHMSSDKATHVKEPHYRFSFTAFRLRLPIPSIHTTVIIETVFLSRQGLKMWNVILLLHGDCCSASVHKFMLWLMLCRPHSQMNIRFKINELNLRYVLIQLIGEESSQYHSETLGNVLFT